MTVLAEMGVSRVRIETSFLRTVAMEHIHVEERMVQLSSYPTVPMDVTYEVSNNN
jgi:hypothetical protein